MNKIARTQGYKSMVQIGKQYNEPYEKDGERKHCTYLHKIVNCKYLHKNLLNLINIPTQASDGIFNWNKKFIFIIHNGIEEKKIFVFETGLY